MNLFNSCIDSF